MDNQININEHQEVKKYDAIKKYLGVLFEPARAFQEIKNQPTLLLPIIIMLVILIATTVLTLPYTKEVSLYQYELMGLSPNHPIVVQQLEKVATVSTGSIIIGIVVNSIAMILGWLFMAGISRLVSMIFVGAGKFTQDLSVFANTSLITFIGALVSTILLIVTGNPAMMNTSLSLFVPFLEKTSFLYWLLNYINIFSLWGIIIAGFGISIVENISKVKAYTIVLVPWLLGKVIMAAYIALFTIPMIMKMG